MTTNIIVRTATEADAVAVSGLTSQLGYAADAETVRQRIRAIVGRGDCLLLVAEQEQGEVCAWLQAHSSEVLESGFRVEIVGLIVAQPMRRRGIGELLVARAETWAREISAGSIVARSNVTRTESHAFYTALGYKTAKTQTVYRKQITGPPDARPSSLSS